MLLAALVLALTPALTPYTIVLGIAQDGGYPQAGCNRDDCVQAWKDARKRQRVASIGIVDPASGQRWIIDATPDFPSQLRTLDEVAPRRKDAPVVDGILLTHAHIGHYLGLTHLAVSAQRGFGWAARPGVASAGDSRSLSPRSLAQRRRDERSRLRCSCTARRQVQRGFSIDDERAGDVVLGRGACRSSR